MVDSGWLIEIPLFHPLSTLYYPPKVLPACQPEEKHEKTEFFMDRL
jgi:hypothetical protein